MSSLRSAHPWNCFYRFLLSIVVLAALVGALPSPGLAQEASDPVIRLSSDIAPPCSGDENASCATKLLTVDFLHTASYEFDCHGSPVDIPWFKIFAALVGIDIPWWVPDPTPESAVCTYLAQGSTFKIYESGSPNPIVDEMYTGWKLDGQFTARPNHTYRLDLNGHGRDFRTILEANNMTFDSFAEVTYQEVDPPDEICQNPYLIDPQPDPLQYAGNLEFSGDEDWQRIRSPLIGKMILSLDVPDHKDYQLEVSSDDCSTVVAISPHGTGVDEQIILPVDQAYYRVHVYGNTLEDYDAWYSVSASFVTDLDDNKWEKAILFSVPINDGNLEYSGDEDWQRILVPPGVAELVLHVPDGKNYDLELWRDDEKVQLAVSSNPAGVDESIPIPLAGYYRIRIYGVHPDLDFNAPYNVYLGGFEHVTLVKDLNQGNASSNFSELINVNSTLYFIADNVLWKSDGTEGGTVKVIDSSGTGGEPSFSNPHELTKVNGLVYFVASPGEDIWVSDGTSDGTQRLNLTYNPGTLSELTAVHARLYFVWRDCGPGSSLCDILMSSSGEIARETVAAHPNVPAFSNLTDVSGTLFYVHADYRSVPTYPPSPPKLYWQLMKVVGSNQEPVVVGDIPGNENNPPGNFHAAGGILYFVANDGIFGPKLWRSDGTIIEMVPATAGPIHQIGGAYGVPEEIADVNGDVYFTDDRALWVINDAGNAEGIFCYFLTTSCVGSIGQLAEIHGRLYFVHSWEYGTTLYKFDGTVVSAVKFYPVIQHPFFVPIINHLTDVGGRLYFAANDGISGAELWTSDGTPAGTTLVADISPGATSSEPAHLTDVNGVLFFTANDGIHGTELWRTSVDNRSPTANANGPYTIHEGSFVTLDASSSFDPDGDLLTYEWDLDNDGIFDDASGMTAVASFPDDGQYPVGVRVTDPAGAGSTGSTTVSVLNVPPAIPGTIHAIGQPALINTSLGFSASFTDPGILDTHTALWDWDDGTGSPGLVEGDRVTGSHSYTKAGLYIVTLSIADDDGGSAAKSFEYVVVVDPKAGFVSGSAWIDSPPGAFLPDLSLAGRATFHVLAKYPEGATVPTGSTEFHLNVANLNFKSTSYEWLVIMGTKAQVKGTGTINHAGNYGFMLSVIDDSPDKFRIKIWNNDTGELIYDSQPGVSDIADPTVILRRGSIVIHKGR